MSDEQNVTCPEVMNHICDRLGEDLQSERCKAIRLHLEGCNSCQNYFQSVECTIEFYRNYSIELPKDTRERLINILGLAGE